MKGSGLLTSEDVRVLFRELAGLSLAQREEYYERSQVPAAVRAELESLLSFDDSFGNSLDSVVGSAATQLLLSNAPTGEGGRCGPYRLVRLLGHGGMGAVYLAERADGEIDQRVAIKFLRAGADLPSFRERFLRERQILASLNHPGIARLLDAGHHEDQPYLVMEYVDGVRIDEYAAKLDPRAVLALTLRVAEAVSYAHRNLIIHRDLKPSNILVDASGQPKLLDFGIARLLDTPEETRTLDRVMTPEYASPEQARGAAQATATDVYSFGAVLYRLLTGRSPHVAAALSRNSGISKDLASILSKAMREEPDERYVSVDQFAGDIQAYLDHRPVQARRGNALYLARKFVRRRWIPTAAAALAVGGLASGLLIADRERVIAEHRFQQVRQLSNQFIDLDADIRTLPGSTKARDRIVSASIGYLERLGSEARVAGWRAPAARDTDLALDIARAYLRVARVQGVPGYSSLGRFAQARNSLTRADSFVEMALADTAFPRRRNALFASAEIAHDAMILAESEHRDAEAHAFADKAAERLDALIRAQYPTPKEAVIAVKLYANLALNQQKLHRLDKSAGYARRSVEMARLIDDPDQPLSKSLGILANTLRFAGDFEAALQAVRESEALARRMADRDNVDSTLALSAALWRKGVILGELNNISLDRPREAVPLLQEAFDLAESLARRDPADYTSRSYLSMGGRELGDILRGSEPARALAIYDQTYRRLEEVRHNPKARADEVWLLTGASYALRRLGRSAESKERIDAAFSILRDLKAYPSASVQLGDESDAALRALGDHYADTRQTPAAIKTYAELHEKAQASNPQPKTDLRHANGLSRIYRDLGILQRRAGHAAEADALDQRRLDLWQYWDQKLPNNPFVQRQLLAAQMN